MKQGGIFNLFLSLVVAVSFSFGGSSLYAQREEHAPRGNANGERRDQSDPQKLRELREKIQELKHEKLKTNLGLDDETARKFFEKYRPAQKDIENIMKQRKQELRNLREQMKNPNADVDTQLKKIQELTRQIQDRVGTLDNDLKPVLSARQRARLLVFEHEFNKKIREKVKRTDRGSKEFRDREELRNRLETFKRDHPQWKERMKNERERGRRFGKRP